MISSHLCKRGRPDKMDNGAGVLYGHMSPSFDLVVVFECNDYTPYITTIFHVENRTCGANLRKLVGTVVNTIYKSYVLHFGLTSHLIQVALKLPENVICGRDTTSSAGISSWWRHQMETFSASLAFGEGNHKGQWRLALIFSFLCTWTNGWASNRDAGDLRRPSAHYDVTVILA